jgi:HK97 family phage portal protein
MTDSQKGFLRRLGSYFGIGSNEPQVARSELPIAATPGYPISPVNLSPTVPDGVSPDRAVGLAPVYRAINILETAVSQLSFGVWKDNAEIVWTDQTYPKFIDKPNLDMSLSAFLQQTVVSLAVSGNAYWLLEGKTTKSAKHNNIVVLNPHETYITYENGQKFYNEGGKTYPAWKIKHLQHTRLPGYDKGVGPIQVAQNELRGALDTRNYGDNWFREGGVPSGILRHSNDTNQLSPDQLAAAKTAFDGNIADKGRGVVALDGDWNYQPVYLSPKDAQFLESRQFDRTQIAMLFGIPATYMLAGVEGNSMTYTNLEMVDTQFVKYTLMKYLREIEEAFTDLTVRGQVVRFKVEVLLRADTKTRYDSYNVATGGQPWLAPNEVREIEGRLPLTAAQLKALKPQPASPVANPNEGGTDE